LARGSRQPATPLSRHGASQFLDATRVGEGISSQEATAGTKPMFRRPASRRAGLNAGLSFF